jgi:ubiquinone/menaquinone biosynthesis C-methylase UbiE
LTKPAFSQFWSSKSVAAIKRPARDIRAWVRRIDLNAFLGRDQVAVVKQNARNIRAWLRLIDATAKAGKLSPTAAALVKSHELHPAGHAVNAFAKDIAVRAGGQLEKYAKSPAVHIEDAIKELIKWKSTIQCAHSHDVSKGYFTDAELVMALQWNELICPLIKDLDFTTVLDLACGHGRNSEYLRRLTKELHLIDINSSCINACRERFGEWKDGTHFHYNLTDGNDLRMIASDTVTLIYTWDSMVHFDKLIVRDYLAEIKRVLKCGGSAFLHHSNYGEKSPDSDWAKNSGTRSDMSAKLMRDYADALNLNVIAQKLHGKAEGRGEDGLDCVSILRKP